MIAIRLMCLIGIPNAGKSNLLEALAMFGKYLGSNKGAIKDFVRYKIPSELFFEENIQKSIINKINKEILEILSAESIREINVSYQSAGEGLQVYSNLNRSFWNGEAALSKINKNMFSAQNYKMSENKTQLDFPFGSNLVQVITSIPELRKIVTKLFRDNDLKLLIEKKPTSQKHLGNVKTELFLPFHMN